jgi:hypothetical protein
MKIIRANVVINTVELLIFRRNYQFIDASHSDLYIQNRYTKKIETRSGKNYFNFTYFLLAYAKQVHKEKMMLYYFAKVFHNSDIIVL